MEVILLTIPGQYFCVICFMFAVALLSWCSLQSCGHQSGEGWPLRFLVSEVSFMCFVTFQFGVNFQKLYLIASIPDLYCLLYNR